MNDYVGAAEERLRRLEAELRQGFEAYGYTGVSTPLLEPLDLFLRKSGDEILSRIYAFSHWNRRLCLRPELTASVMRAYVNELQGQSLPLRLHYAGATFRYEKPQRGRSRQFTQVGVEMIGAAGSAADAEILHLACAGLERAGVTRYRLVVGHLGVVLQMLRQLGMSEHAQGLILDIMEQVTRGRRQIDDAVSRVVELLGGTPDGLVDPSHLLPDALADLSPEEALVVASDILRRARLPMEGGARRPQEIIQRLLARAGRTDPTTQVRRALEFVVELHALAGSPGRTSELRALVQRHGLSTAPLDEVERACELLALYGTPTADVVWEMDLSLARGLRYYTGLVFEVYGDTPEGPLQVCGGGRYDDLIRALGGRHTVPACGFSFGLERVDMAGGAAQQEKPRQLHVLVAGVTDADHPAALLVARTLRGLGDLVVQQDVRVRGPKATLRHADRSGVDVTILIGEQERAAGMVVVRDMGTRAETTVRTEDLSRWILERQR